VSTKNSRPTKNKPLETFLPAFGGFYQTHWEQLLTDSEELYVAMYAETEREKGGLSRNDLAGLLSETSSVRRLCSNIARTFCEHFEEEMSERLGFRLGLKFSKLDSPSEYNFTTDRILAGMPLRSAKKLFETSMQEGHQRLEEAVGEQFTPYPGFVPYYSANVDDWTAKPIDRWEAVELCVLLAVFIDTDIDEELYHAVAEHGACVAFEESVDWKRFEQKADALRRKRTTAFLKSVVFEGEAS
jgi:hypothetical protein